MTRRRSEDGKPGEDRADRTAESVVRALSRLAQEILARKEGAHLVERELATLHLECDLTLDGDGTAAARRLAGEVERRIDEAIRRAVAFRPGRAFCHRCGGSDCDHARPTSSRDVLAAYAPTGMPVWKDFGQLMLDARHERVEDLYRDRPAVLTRVAGAEQVERGVLAAFQHPDFRVWGQLVAGWFDVAGGPAEGKAVVALTAQVIAARSTRRPSPLSLNVIGVAPDGRDLGSLWEKRRELPWRRSVRWAQAALSTVPNRRGRERVVAERVESILLAMARRLERGERARSRRTRHAEERHDSGGRPTRMATGDIRRALPEDLLLDERSEAWVVLGRKGRTHFLADDGRLVSSVRYTREAIAKRRKTGHWVEVDPARARDVLGRARARIDTSEPARSEDPRNRPRDAASE